MNEAGQSTVSWRPEGYVEIVFVGTQTPEQIRELDRQARVLLDEHIGVGTAGLLIDARHGRVGRDASSFSVIMRLSRERRLNRFVVLVDENPTDPHAGRETGVIVSMVTTALGKRPIYIYDETAARTLAASE
ncbi:MAG TPA: hypothetical protein PLD25_15015 [Chloroflexota bacterium]|nr:hypothetical protein [Chloroflexota bacterium]HUM69112.1 hypothetical protein [Chloroflexota bacterium]